MNSPAYILGHSEWELSRLRAQARLLEPTTRQFLRDAGIVAGMRVLDIGSGAGDVAFLAADLVGSSGEVVGTDRVPAAITAATHSAHERGFRNVVFRLGDAADLSFDRPFDAVVGRYVLLFQADPADVLRRLARLVQPGGLMVFHEPDWVFARSMPPAPTYDRCCGWIRDTFRIAGTDANMADKLYTAFVQAGLGTPSMRLSTYIGGGANCSEFLQAVADIVATLVPTLTQQGLATPAEVDAKTLAGRLKAEVEANASVIVGRSEVVAWVRV